MIAVRTDLKLPRSLQRLEDLPRVPGLEDLKRLRLRRGDKVEAVPEV